MDETKMIVNSEKAKKGRKERQFICVVYNVFKLSKGWPNMSK